MAQIQLQSDRSPVGLADLADELRRAREALDAAQGSYESQIAGLRGSLVAQWEALHRRIEAMAAERRTAGREWDELLARKTRQWRKAQDGTRRELRRLREEVRRLKAKQRRRRRGLFGWLRR